MGGEITLLTWFLLCSYEGVKGGDVAVIMGGYSDPSQATTPYSQSEFFTERQESCVYSQEFSNISTIFDYSWAKSSSDINLRRVSNLAFK